MFDQRVSCYLRHWKLIPEGEVLSTPSSWLLPVRYQARAAMLKIARVPEEARSSQLMCWWNGDAAAPVFLHEPGTLLMERACGPQSLTEMARAGHDAEAARILCDTAMRLHRVTRADQPPALVPLSRWFRDLQPAAARWGGVLAQSLAASKVLLNNPMQVGVLHGDIHHANVLDFASRGWLAIDPKGLLGERAFDFANILCNPDSAHALAPGRLPRLLRVISDTTGIPQRRMLQWVVAWAGLSAAWVLLEGSDAHLQLSVASLAAAELTS
jgi:streptomycin 6-kinase